MAPWFLSPTYPVRALLSYQSPTGGFTVIAVLIVSPSSFKKAPSVALCEGQGDKYACEVIWG